MSIIKATKNIGSSGDNTHLEMPEQAAGGRIWGEVNRNEVCRKDNMGTYALTTKEK